MDEHETLKEIEIRLSSGAETESETLRSDVRFLLDTVANRDRKIGQLEKKNQVLTEHVAELTQEIENVKMDFGGQR